MKVAMIFSKDRKERRDRKETRGETEKNGEERGEKEERKDKKKNREGQYLPRHSVHIIIGAIGRSIGHLRHSSVLGAPIGVHVGLRRESARIVLLVERGENVFK
jgi:hypothetical protein